MDRFLLLVYLSLLVWLSYTQNMTHLLYASLILTLFTLLSVLSGKGRSWSVRFVPVALGFALFISLPYSLWTGDYSYVQRVFLRVLSMYLLTFLFVSHVNLYSALSFSKSLSYMLVLVAGFVNTYRRQLTDFSQSLESRSLRKPGSKEFLRFLQRVVLYFFNRSVSDMEEVSRAMKSRGLEID